MSRYVKEGFEELKNKILFIICIPLFVDILGLILYGKIFNFTNYSYWYKINS